jgi:hypothetical protein
MEFVFKEDHLALVEASKRMEEKYKNLEYPPAYRETFEGRLILIVRVGVYSYNVYFKTE